MNARLAGGVHLLIQILVLLKVYLIIMNKESKNEKV